MGHPHKLIREAQSWLPGLGPSRPRLSHYDWRLSAYDTRRARGKTERLDWLTGRLVSRCSDEAVIIPSMRSVCSRSGKPLVHTPISGVSYCSITLSEYRLLTLKGRTE